MEFLVTWLVSLVLFLVVPFYSVPKEVDSYYKEFMGIVKKECPKIETPRQFGIYFRRLKNEEVGLCTLYPFKRIIEIDTFFWVNANNNIRRQLVFHELTHCILETHHTDDIQNYMNPYLISLPNEVLIEQVKTNANAFCN